MGDGLLAPPGDRAHHPAARGNGIGPVQSRGQALVPHRGEMLQAPCLEQLQGGGYAEEIALPSGEGTAEVRVVVPFRDPHPEPGHDSGSPPVMSPLSVRAVAPVVRPLGDVIVLPRRFPGRIAPGPGEPAGGASRGPPRSPGTRGDKARRGLPRMSAGSVSPRPERDTPEVDWPSPTRRQG